MMRKFLFYLMLLFSGALLAQQTPGTIAGKVTDEKGEAVIGATATAKQSGRDVTSVSTDIDGFFDLSGLQPGSYDLEVTYTGYRTALITGISISSGGRYDQKVKLELPTEGITLTTATVTAAKTVKATDGTVIGKEQIGRMASVDIGSIAAMSAKTSQKDEGQAVSTAGARTSSNDVYIDGQRVSNKNIAAEEVESIQVLTGGLPAMYGDVTGSITALTLKMPSSKFSGYVDYQNSLDAYQFRRGTVGLSGPILKNKETGKNIIGFRLSGNGVTTLDGSPSALGSFKLKDEAYNAIIAKPLTTYNGNPTPSAIYINRDMLESTNIRPNNSQLNGQLNGSLFFQINKDMEVRVQGQYSASDDKQASDAYRLFNYDRNPSALSSDWRIMGKFIHTIPITDAATDKRNSSTSLRLSKMFYSLQADYEQNTSSISDPIHKDNLFGYGHVGAFYNRYTIINPNNPVYSTVLDKYDAGNSSNPILSRYNANFTSNEMGSYVYQNGLYNSSVVNFYGSTANSDALYAAPGAVFNRYRKAQGNQLGVRVQGGLELKGKGLNKHTVSFGFTFEQRTDRSYRIKPRDLWTLARQKVNTHISDVSKVIGMDPNGNPIYSPVVKVENIDPFGSNLRKSLGIADTTWVNIDELDPSKLSMSMFSADELTSQRSVFDRFFGYDYLGNPLGSDVKFDDFFSKDLTRRVAPFSPTYFAGYLEDNFHFQGATIRLGLRLDRYDANTKVLKDPYTLYSAYTVGDFQGKLEGTQRYKQIDPNAIPSTVPSTAVVYVGGGSSNDLSNRNLLLYRDGSQWYNGEGVQINNPSEIVSKAGLSVPVPARTDVVLKENIQDADYEDYKKAFVDYKPQLIVMPRLYFSFPFNDSKSNFFAHYDIVAQRPNAGQGFASAFDYYNFQSNLLEPGFIFGNPNLKPQQVTDYAVGFLQQLGEKENASLKLEFYYKEFRNMMQARKMLFAYPANYDTYDNIDFSTTKGLSVEYNVTPDRQNGGRTSLMFNYTLQFADGTGSDASSSAGSAAVLEGQLLRTSFPLSFDTRHRFVVNMDYRFLKGDGPKIGKTHILENVGLNLTTDLQSGTPYSRKQYPTSFTLGDGSNTIGSLNGFRQPWLLRFDFRIDKSFAITRKIIGAESGDRKKLFGINVYLRVQNLLNTQNVINVYNFTGTALNDGYLTDGSANGPQTLQSNIASYGTDSYGIMYDLRMRNPANISQPRRIFLGVNFSF